MNDNTVTVHVVGIPTDLHQRATEHFDGLRREFALISGGDPAASPAPAKLIALIDELGDRFGTVVEQPRRESEAAVARGAATFDVTYELPRDAAQAARHFGDLLDQADAYCRSGEHLLTLVAPDDVRAYRRWFLDELIGQVEGAAPTPYATWSARPAAEPPAEPPVAPPPNEEPALSLPEGWQLHWKGDTAELRIAGELDLASGADLRGVISHIHASGPRHVVIDLTGVTFIDSVGISVLAFAHTRLREGGASLEITIPARLRTLFEVTGFSAVLDAGSP